MRLRLMPRALTRACARSYARNMEKALRAFDFRFAFRLVVAALLPLAAIHPALAAGSQQPYVFASHGADLHAAPDDASPVIAHLDRLTEVSILRKQRGWLRVRAAGNAQGGRIGWLREGQVRKPWQPGRAQRARHSLLGAFASLFGGNNAPGKTAVLGVRGLEDEGSGAQGQRDMAGVQWMERIAITPEETRRFVREGKLNP